MKIKRAKLLESMINTLLSSMGGSATCLFRLKESIINSACSPTAIIEQFLAAEERDWNNGGREIAFEGETEEKKATMARNREKVRKLAELWITKARPVVMQVLEEAGYKNVDAMPDDSEEVEAIAIPMPMSKPVEAG